MKKNLLASVSLICIMGMSALETSNPVQYQQEGIYVPPGYMLVPSPQSPGGMFYPNNAAPASIPTPNTNSQPPDLNNQNTDEQNTDEQPTAQQPVAPGFELPTQQNQNTATFDNIVIRHTIGIVRTPGSDQVGTGFVFLSSSDEVLVSTAFHVVRENMHEANFEVNGKIYNGKVIYTKPEKDQAVIRLENTQNLIPAKIGSPPHINDAVTCYGWKNGTIWVVGSYAIDHLNASTVFPYNQKTKTAPYQVNALNVVHTTNNTPLQPGMSGGPCFNQQKEVIGFNSASIDQYNGLRGYIGTPVF